MEIQQMDCSYIDDKMRKYNFLIDYPEPRGSVSIKCTRLDDSQTFIGQKNILSYLNKEEDFESMINILEELMKIGSISLIDSTMMLTFSITNDLLAKPFTIDLFLLDLENKKKEYEDKISSSADKLIELFESIGNTIKQNKDILLKRNSSSSIQQDDCRSIISQNNINQANIIIKAGY
jgi:hypothetical protein